MFAGQMRQRLRLTLERSASELPASLVFWGMTRCVRKNSVRIKIPLQIECLATCDGEEVHRSLVRYVISVRRPPRFRKARIFSKTRHPVHVRFLLF